MLFRVAALAILSASSVTSSNVRSEHRRLSYAKIAGYEPGSQVTDHAAIDMDQAAMETQLKLGTDEGFAMAKKIYMEGANSKSYATVTVNPPLTADVAKSAVITGVNAAGTQVAGKAKGAAAAGATTIDVQYATADSGVHVECRVGALTEELGAVTKNCLAATGAITIDGGAYTYTYNVMEDNKAGRNIMGFSTAAQAKMFDKKHDEYLKYFNYYGQYDYAHQWVVAAFEGGKTDFTNGNADFSQYGAVGKTEAIKKGTAYMSVYMYVLREFEDAISDCQDGCIACNDDPVHAWDEGVAFYAGSMEGEDGAGGKLVYALAEKRCQNFKTCGEDGGEKEGKSMVNSKLIPLFEQGKSALQAGECKDVRPIVTSITRLMTVPLVQGSLRYAYKVDKLGGGEKENAEGAVFAAAVLPVVHACDADAAATIYKNLKAAATPKTNSTAVKEAFESQYECMEINCEMVGGLLNGDVYYPDYCPCGQTCAVASEDSAAGSKTVVMALATTIGALVVSMLA